MTNTPAAPRFEIETRAWKPLAVDESELMTLTAAAKLLGLKHVNTFANLVERGTVRRVRDLSENNPVKQTRVFRADVEAELSRRRARRKLGDLRIRGRR